MILAIQQLFFLTTGVGDFTSCDNGVSAGIFHGDSKTKEQGKGNLPTLGNTHR
jgi:hypothetical protein